METITIKEFKAKNGAPFPKEKAEEIGTELEKIQNKFGGKLSTKTVLEEAREETSVLHPYFEWDDSVAAEKHRLYQARNLVNHLEVVYIEKDISISAPAFINIKNTTGDDENPERSYVDSVTVTTNENYREQAIQDALRQLIAWKKKYKWLNEFTTITQNINQLETDYKALLE